jgi:predicted nucleotidyltransferase
MDALESELAKIVDSIEKNYHPEKIVLFGSLAEGRLTKGCDIDLLVIKDTDKDPWSRSEEVDRFIQHTVPVDVLVYTPREIEERLGINDSFLKEILETGKVLYERRI